MRAVDPARADTIDRTREYLETPPEIRLQGLDERRRRIILEREQERGVMIDPLSGNEMALAPEDVVPDIDQDMYFWTELDRDLIGARAENGHLLPSEVDHVLDRWGIQDEQNREVSRLILALMAAGRNEAANEKIDRPGGAPNTNSSDK